MLGGCIPAVLIVTIFQSPYNHDHTYFSVLYLMYCSFYFSCTVAYISYVL